MDLSIPRVLMSGLPAPSAEDIPPSPSEPEEGKETTLQLRFVGGPRPTMTKLQVNYNLFLTYHVLNPANRLPHIQGFEHLSFGVQSKCRWRVVKDA